MPSTRQPTRGQLVCVIVANLVALFSILWHLTGPGLSGTRSLSELSATDLQEAEVQFRILQQDAASGRAMICQS